MYPKGSDLLKKFISYISVIIAVLLTLSSCGAPKTVMTVGGYELTEDVDALFNGDEALRNSFLAPYALAQEVGIDIESDDFRDAVSASLQRVFTADYGANEEALDDELEQMGISREVYEKIVEQDTLKELLYDELTKNGTIETDESVLLEKFLSGEAVRVKRILVLYSNHEKAEADERINEAAERVALGTPFETVMKDYAEYDLAKGDIGNLGDSFVLLRGNTEESYEEVCFSLAVGEVSDVFETSVGLCIVKRYPMTAEDIAPILSDLASSYSEGRFASILDEAAGKIG